MAGAGGAGGAGGVGAGGGAGGASAGFAAAGMLAGAASQGSVSAMSGAQSRLGAFAPGPAPSTKVASYKALAAFSSVAQGAGLATTSPSSSGRPGAPDVAAKASPSSVVHISAQGRALAASGSSAAPSAAGHAAPPLFAQDPTMKRLNDLVAALVMLLALDASKHHTQAAFALGILAGTLSVQAAQGAGAASSGSTPMLGTGSGSAGPAAA